MKKTSFILALATVALVGCASQPQHGPGFYIQEIPRNVTTPPGIEAQRMCAESYVKMMEMRGVISNLRLSSWDAYQIWYEDERSKHGSSGHGFAMWALGFSYIHRHTPKEKIMDIWWEDCIRLVR